MNADTSFSPPAHLTDYKWRSVEREDIPAIQALMAAVIEEDKTGGVTSEEHLTQILDLLGERAETDAIEAVTVDGSIAALAFVFFSPAEDEHLAMMEGIVDVSHRGRGLGSAVLDWMESRARQEFGQNDDDLPRMMRMSCADHLTDRITLFEGHGFEAVRYAYEMQRDLGQPIPHNPLPAGLHLVPWSKENDSQLMNAFNEAFKGNWGLSQVNEELWKMLFTEVPQFRADLTYLAVDEDSDVIAGFCLNWVDASKNTQTGVQEGWVEAIGVVPAWRGRGLASALMTQILNDFVAQGFERAALDVDSQNPTGALRLYEKLGFEAVKRTIVFAKRW